MIIYDHRAKAMLQIQYKEQITSYRAPSFRGLSLGLPEMAKFISSNINFQF